MTYKAMPFSYLTMSYERVDEFDCDGFQIVYSITADEDSEIKDCFIARVQAFKKGFLLGEEYLGGCCYKDPLDLSYLEDMTQEAITSAKLTIQELTEG